MASPQVSLAALATRTKRIKLGRGIVVLPFHNPIRVAEDFAFLDLLSDGRVELGVGRGYQPIEFAGFRVDQSHSREMFAEAVQLIKQCWTEDRVNFQGKYYQAEDLCVRPKPLQQPHPPIYMACLCPETFAIAGASGFDIFMSSAFGLTAQQAKEGIAAYRKAREEAGYDGATGKVANLFMIYPAETRERAYADFRDPVTWYYRTIAKYVAPPAGQQAVKRYEGYKDVSKLASAVQFEDLINDPILCCGDVEECTDKVIEMARDFGFNEMLC